MAKSSGALEIRNRRSGLIPPYQGLKLFKLHVQLMHGTERPRCNWHVCYVESGCTVEKAYFAFNVI